MQPWSFTVLVGFLLGRLFLPPSTNMEGNHLVFLAIALVQKFGRHLLHQRLMKKVMVRAIGKTGSLVRPLQALQRFLLSMLLDAFRADPIDVDPHGAKHSRARPSLIAPQT